MKVSRNVVFFVRNPKTVQRFHLPVTTLHHLGSQEDGKYGTRNSRDNLWHTANLLMGMTAFLILTPWFFYSNALSSPWVISDQDEVIPVPNEVDVFDFCSFHGCYFGELVPEFFGTDLEQFLEGLGKLHELTCSFPHVRATDYHSSTVAVHIRKSKVSPRRNRASSITCVVSKPNIDRKQIASERKCSETDDSYMHFNKSIFFFICFVQYASDDYAMKLNGCATQKSHM